MADGGAVLFRRDGGADRGQLGSTPLWELGVGNEELGIFPKYGVGAGLCAGPFFRRRNGPFQRRRGGNLPPGGSGAGMVDGRTQRSAPTGSCFPFRFVLFPPRREGRVFGGEGGVHFDD